MENIRWNNKNVKARLAAYNKAVEKMLAEQAREEEKRRREKEKQSRKETEKEQTGEGEETQDLAEVFWDFTSFFLECAVVAARIAEKLELEGLAFLE